MTRYPALFAAAALMIAPNMPVFAEAVDPDVRCLLVSNVFAAKDTEPKGKQIATLAVSFYLGRIDAKLTQAQFRASVLAIGKEPMGKDVARTMTVCAKALEARQVAVSQMIQSIARDQIKTR